MVRARFMDNHYARLVIVKNLAAFCLAGGGAFWFGSAKMALMGACFAIAGSVISVRAALHDPQSPPRLASRATASMAVRYGFPVIAANAANDIVFAQAFRQSPRNEFEQFVAIVVAERIVDHFEVVEVEQQQSDCTAKLVDPV